MVVGLGEDGDFYVLEEAPELARIVISVDPAMSSKKASDETGIVVVGLGEDGDFYVLEDLSGRYSVESKRLPNLRGLLFL